jgi:hypothetical protein
VRIVAQESYEGGNRRLSPETQLADTASSLGALLRGLLTERPDQAVERALG